jgi:hypothetical protein
VSSLSVEIEYDFVADFGDGVDGVVGLFDYHAHKLDGTDGGEVGECSHKFGSGTNAEFALRLVPADSCDGVLH